MKATVALVALLVATCASAARVASLPVVIEELGEAAKACGLSESELESVALRTLESSRLQPDGKAGGSLNVRVTARQKRRSGCVAHVSVQMKAFAKPLPSGGIASPEQHPSDPDVVICNEAGDYSAPKADFSVEVESAVEHSIGQCLGSLKY